MIPKFKDEQPMQMMSKRRLRLVHCGKSFLSPAIYRSAYAKIIVMSGSVFQALIHFHSASTNAIHLQRLPP